MSDEPQLVLCQVTGQEVPESETVVLNGWRVCAQGKAILLERMKGGQNPVRRPVQPRRAPAAEPLHPGFGLRFGAWIIDAMVVGVPTGIVVFIVTIVTTIGNRNGHPEGMDPQTILYPQAAGLLMGLAGFGYFALMHGIKGQTLGKMACDLKVVMDGELAPLTLSQAVYRQLWLNGPSLLAGLITVILAAALPHPSPFMGMGIGFLPSLYILISAIISAADGDKQQAVHDRMGKTRVVRVGALKQMAKPPQDEVHSAILDAAANLSNPQA